MPECFVQVPNGDLFAVNGIDAPLVWDGFAETMMPAGVTAPTTAITLSGSGVGLIAGEYYAYVRYVDRNGNVSNLSPISALYTASSTAGSISGATNASPIVITTSAAHGLTTGRTVRIVEVAGNEAANGTWLITVVSSTTFSLDDSTGDGNYAGSGLWSSGVETITYASVPISSDPKHVGRQILRNLDGSTEVFYVDVDARTDMVSTTFTSTRSDEDLSTQEAQAILDETGRVFANRFGVPPNHRAVMAHHKDRMYAGVVVPYEEGHIEVTLNSATVTGVGTEWTSQMEGRFLYASGGLAAYEIDSVDVANQTLTLGDAYQGDTDAFLKYSIKPGDQDSRSIDWSSTGLPEAWLATDSITVQEDGDVLTGLMPKSSFIYFLEERHIYRFSVMANPLDDGHVFLSSERGCINNRCWVIVDDTAYMLDRSGIHAFTGGSTEALSSLIAELWSEDGDTHINWSGYRYFHAVYFPGQETVRWFVSLAGMYPRHAIAMHIRTKRFWIEEYAEPVIASCLGTMQSRPRVFLGTRDVLAFWMGGLDGPDATAGSVAGTVTSATWTSITDTGALFAADVVGAPVCIVDGPGKGQVRLITARSSTRLDLDRPFLTMPTSRSTYQVGGVPYQYKTGWYRFAKSEDQARRHVELHFEPQESGQMDLRQYFDRASEPEVMEITKSSEEGTGVKATEGSADLVVDLTKETGFVSVGFDGRKFQGLAGKRLYALEVRGFSTEETTLHEIVIEGVQQ